jgi:hypothetical protein
VKLIIPYQAQQILIEQEAPYIPAHNPKSMDNLRSADGELIIGEAEHRPSSRHRITVADGEEILASKVLLAAGGASGIHPNSAIVRGNKCFIAVGPFICSLELPSLRLEWFTAVDSATCFGVYDAPMIESLISHGELKIARVTYSGDIIWSVGGADIFSEGFKLHPGYAEAVDFNGRHYKFDLQTGREL